MRSILISVAALAAAAAAIAPASAKSAVEGSSDQVVLRPNAAGKLCTPAQMVTGSILPQRVCKTREEWAADAKAAKVAL